MEAALCATPSAALRVGGLPESIVDGETGLLADDGPELTAKVRAWSRTARCASGSARPRASARRDVHVGPHGAETLACSRRGRGASARALRETLARSETLKAAGLAAATLAANAVALVFTVLFARMLGADGYGSLAALISTFLILAVPGAAVQVAVARETRSAGSASGAAAGRDAGALAPADAARACAVVGGRGAAARADRRPAVGDEEWAAAATSPDRLPVAAAVGRARRAAGPARVPAGGWSLLLEAPGGSWSASCWSPRARASPARTSARRCRCWPRPPARVGAARRLGGPRRRRTRREWLRDLMGGAWPAVAGLFLSPCSRTST